ncbi:hypothetical protein [Nonomuraea endophytica]|uniref:Uncharacterized protein n=1 Tax=Nonomuraea endophytica TaxID=714136 RepID=A0A7W8EGD3_9ACTN|nr:hypothetical protein [Nonomuraea endophytica]MBB5078489.1 hypothetical protein [Nonomuraea endophytica]
MLTMLGMAASLTITLLLCFLAVLVISAVTLVVLGVLARPR